MYFLCWDYAFVYVDSFTDILHTFTNYCKWKVGFLAWRRFSNWGDGEGPGGKGADMLLAFSVLLMSGKSSDSNDCIVSQPNVCETG